MLAASPAPPSVSVVICCYSLARFADVCAAVASVRGQVRIAPEAVVVVDHNPDLRERLVRALPDVRVVDNDGPPGLSGARNAGIAATTGDLVIFLDDDARAAPDMTYCMAVAAGDASVLGVAGRVLPDWQGGDPQWFPDEFLWVVGCTYAGMSAGPVRNPIGAAMAVRREVFEAVGGFVTDLGRTQTGLPLGCEETELAIRAARAFPGCRFVYDPEASCRHRVPTSRATWRYLAMRCWAEGLSKAALTRVASAGEALSTERIYLRRTLPRALVRGFAGPLHGDPAGAARAAAILLGLACTVAGYLAGRIRTQSGAVPPVVRPRVEAA